MLFFKKNKNTLYVIVIITLEHAGESLTIANKVDLRRWNRPAVNTKGWQAKQRQNSRVES